MATQLMGHRLSGVRLGRQQRWLLVSAPTPQALLGYVLEHPDRAVRESLRRVAGDLELLGLVSVEKVRARVRARDPRRETPIFHDDRFWTRRDPAQVRLVRRNAVWQTPFGFEIFLRYRRELESGRAIRWDPDVVEVAEKVAARTTVDLETRRVFAAERAGELRDSERVQAFDRDLLEPLRPEEVRTASDAERNLAVAVVARDTRSLSGVERYAEARDLFLTKPLEDLRQLEVQVPRTPAAAPTRSERARRVRLSPLGVPVDPRIQSRRGVPPARLADPEPVEDREG